MTSAKERREKRKVSARQRATDHKTGFESMSVRLPDGVNFWQIKKEGVYRIDIIPYEVPEGANNPYAEPGTLHFERTYWTHRNVGPDNSVVVCPKKSLGKPCPICEYRAKIAKQPDTDEDLLKDLAPKERQLWNIFDHDNVDSGIQVWDVSYHLFGKALDARVKNADEDEGYEFFADPEDGMTLKIGMEEKNFAGNSFFSAESIDFRPRRTPIDDELLSKAVILDGTLIVHDYEKLKSMFLQAPEEAPEEGVEKIETVEEEKPKRIRKPSKVPTAQEFGIEKGDTVVYKKLTCTVMRISPDGTSLTLMDEDDNVHKAVGADEVKSLEEAKKSSAPTKKSKPKVEEEEEPDVEEPEEWDATWDD